MTPARLTTRILGGPALRLQPDGRLVTLVRQGYESAFEEIFRRYGAPLRSYAASIVTPQRADDVTQEAFTKAYLALRGTDKEIQLRPWLYRIVRNTALTNLRDEPKAGVELDEAHAAGMSAEELAEQREEIKRLTAGLRDLPEPQRAAIVMRELEGLSHEQIAASLGLSGGAVRQSIYRARRTLREGVGLLLPLPVLRMLLDEGVAQGASAAAAGGSAGIAVKTGAAALLAAGTVTTGAVVKDELRSPSAADATPQKTKLAGTAPGAGGSGSVSGTSSGSGVDDGRRGRNRGRGGEDEESDRGSNSGPGSGSSGSGDGGHSGSGGGESSGPGGGDSGSSGSGSSGSGSSGSGSSGSGSGGSGFSGSGSSGSGSGSSGSGSGDSGSDDPDG